MQGAWTVPPLQGSCKSQGPQVGGVCWQGLQLGPERLGGVWGEDRGLRSGLAGRLRQAGHISWRLCVPHSPAQRAGVEQEGAILGLTQKGYHVQGVGKVHTFVCGYLWYKEQGRADTLPIRQVSSCGSAG